MWLTALWSCVAGIPLPLCPSNASLPLSLSLSPLLVTFGAPPPSPPPSLSVALTSLATNNQITSPNDRHIDHPTDRKLQRLIARLSPAPRGRRRPDGRALPPWSSSRSRPSSSSTYLPIPAPSATSSKVSTTSATTTNTPLQPRSIRPPNVCMRFRSSSPLARRYAAAVLLTAIQSTQLLPILLVIHHLIAIALLWPLFCNSFCHQISLLEHTDLS